MNAALKPLPQYALESVASVTDEIKPLIAAHYDEIATYKDIPLRPNWDAYHRAEVAGILRIYTARFMDRLVGYSIFLVTPALHYETSVQANEDVLFILPEYRKGRVGMNLIRYADESLEREGVQVLRRHVKARHDFGPLLERMGYQLEDYMFSRRLGG